MVDLRKASIMAGLVPPDVQAAMCGCSGEHKTVSISQMITSMRPHRWREMRALQKRTFIEMMELTTKYEERILKALGLPDINTVRAFALGLADGEPGVFRFAGGMQEVAELVNKWMYELLGPELSQRKTPFADMDFTRFKFLFIRFMMEAFDIGARRVYNDLKAQVDDAGILLFIAADPNRDYLRAMLQEGASRITTEIAVNRLDEVRKELVAMAAKGEWPIKVARRLHDIIGEGAAWYWRRIAQSEATLAVNQAFNHMARDNGAGFEEWDAGPNCCVICAYLDGKAWRVGEGPEPGTSTHPHCGCARVAVYKAGRPVQDRWFRRPPYGDGNGWTQEELQAFREGIQTTRRDQFPLSEVPE